MRRAARSVPSLCSARLQSCREFHPAPPDVCFLRPCSTPILLLTHVVPRGPTHVAPKLCVSCAWSRSCLSCSVAELSLSVPRAASRVWPHARFARSLCSPHSPHPLHSFVGLRPLHSLHSLCSQAVPEPDLGQVVRAAPPQRHPQPKLRKLPPRAALVLRRRELRGLGGEAGDDDQQWYEYHALVQGQGGAGVAACQAEEGLRFGEGEAGAAGGVLGGWHVHLSPRRLCQDPDRVPRAHEVSTASGFNGT